MIDQLESIEQRYEELEQAMSKPDVASDHLKFQVLAQEYSALKNLVSLGREYRDVINEIESVQT